MTELFLVKVMVGEEPTQHLHVNHTHIINNCRHVAEQCGERGTTALFFMFREKAGNILTRSPIHRCTRRHARTWCPIDLFTTEPQRRL